MNGGGTTMGLLQKACETYDNMAHLAGVYRDGHEVLAPVSHSLTSNNAVVIEITVDAGGKFVNAEAVGKENSKTIYPVTIDSAGRAGTKAFERPHPLCDQIKYLTPKGDDNYYIPQLEAWFSSPFTHPKLLPILTCVKSGTIGDNLAKLFEKNKKISASLDKGDAFIRWRVIGLGEKESGPCWNDPSLFDAYIRYYADKLHRDAQVLCMISGDIQPLSEQHPKGIIPINGNAKLISANDSVNFTYRGRFVEEEQAATVGYLPSQKAHNALRWLASESGASVVYGGRTFICWNPKGKPLPKPTGPMRRKQTEHTVEPTEYRKRLRDLLLSYKSELPDNEDVIIASFDAATTGRLALSYYNELRASDFLDRMAFWEDTCCWNSQDFGISSPSLPSIVICAFGNERGESGTETIEVDDKIMRQQLQTLLNCRIEKAAMPLTIMQALVQKASNPSAYKNDKNREKVLFTACAVIRKYRFDVRKEEWSMAFDYDKEDRDYLFGGLLALLEKAERCTFSQDEAREPNAIRMQTVFSKRPMYASKIVWERVKNSYYPRLPVGLRMYYEQKIGAIWEKLGSYSAEELNKPLKETYLLGYYLMRNELNPGKKNNDNNENAEDVEK